MKVTVEGMSTALSDGQLVNALEEIEVIEGGKVITELFWQDAQLVHST